MPEIADYGSRRNSPRSTGKSASLQGHVFVEVLWRRRPRVSRMPPMFAIEQHAPTACALVPLRSAGSDATGISMYPGMEVEEGEDAPDPNVSRGWHRSPLPGTCACHHRRGQHGNDPRRQHPDGRDACDRHGDSSCLACGGLDGGNCHCGRQARWNDGANSLPDLV